VSTTARRRGERVPLPPVLYTPLLVGALLALAGGYWDDAWHTERGRDSFFIAPHVAIYGGVAAAAGALALWAAIAARAQGVRAVVADRPLALALLSVGVTLASGPIDNAWHAAFGRDAVIWSAPHLLGIVGTSGLAAAVLVESTRATHSWNRLLRPVAGALTLAALAFVVVEYETDVPQFDAVWYLPVLSLGSGLALALVRVLDPARWAAASAAMVHLAFVTAVAVFLVGAGFDAPKLPLLAVPAVVLDLAARRGASLALRGLLFVTALYAVYVPTLNWTQTGTRIDGVDVIAGFPLAFAGAWLAFAALGLQTRTETPPRTGAAAAAALFVLALPAVALAHDPGQGDDSGAFRFVATANGRTLSVDATRVVGGCAQPDRSQLVARRAGEVLRAPLAGDRCRYVGTIEVTERGRWFLYVELRDGENVTESWLPVRAGDGTRRVVDDRRYAYEPRTRETDTVETIAAVVLYLLVIAFLAAVVALARAHARPETAGP
jgi:hypothetical protein